MGKYLKIIAVFLICSICAGIVQPASVNAAPKISINKTKATLTVGETLSLQITGTTAKTIWESSNNKIAEVSSEGKVTSVKAGKANITATVSNKKYTCSVTVKAVSKDFIIKKGVLTKYKGNSKKVKIPAIVKSIGQSAFADCDSLTSITIPASVKSIGARAFADCDRLTAITIPTSVKSIGRDAFHGTIWLSKKQKKDALVIVNGILIDGITSVGKVTIPDSVTSIGDRAFYKCSKLTSIEIPDSVTKIGDSAFYKCSKLKSITIPDSVKKIGDKAFYGCNSLTIIGSDGSYAQSYAKKQGITFEISKTDRPAGDISENETVPINTPQQGTPSSNNSGSENNIYSVSFYDGSRLIDTLYATKDQPLGKVPTVQKTSKGNAIFVGWFTDAALTQSFYSDSPVKGNMTVYGKYTDLQSETLNITSFAQLDQSPDLSFTVVRAGGSAIEPKDAFTLVTKDGSGIVPLKWEDISNGTYTVFADGGFNQGCSYELTLADGYSFQDKPVTIRTASFAIAMAEVEKLKMSDEIVYIQDTEAMKYTISGTDNPVDVLTPSLVPQSGGTFTYDNASGLKAGDIICFYITTSPKDRDYINISYNEDPEVYVEVESVSGTTISFGALEDTDMEALYEAPDNFPVIVSELPVGDTGTVLISALDTETYALMLSAEDGTLEKAKAKVNAGDFVSIYTSSYKTAFISGESVTVENAVYFAEITAYDSASGTITYSKTTEEAIENCMNLYITPEVKGDDLITLAEKSSMEAQILAQVEDSNFAEDAAYLLAEMATKTDGFRSARGVKEFLLCDENGDPLSENEISSLSLGTSFELKDGVKLTVELITSGDQLHFSDGVQLAIGIDATFEVETDDGGKVAIDLSATFAEEVALGINIKGSLVKKRILGIPVPTGVSVSSAVDVKNFTAFDFDVNIYTIAPEEKSTWEKLKNLLGDTKIGGVLDQIEEVQTKIEQAQDSAEQIQAYLKDVENMWESISTNGSDPKTWMKDLGKTSITKDLMGMLNLSTETNINSGKYAESLDDLMQKYSEMLQKETDWVELIRKEMFSKEYCYYGIAIAVSVDFVVRADLNIAMGSSLEYEVGKRYSFWFKVGLFKPSAGSSTMDLIDERFAFQFYVMGKIGLKMGVSAKIAVGIGSTKFASVAIITELGPYIKLYGFFIYEYEKMRPANTTAWKYNERKAGALYLEFGAYFMLDFEASALKIFDYSHNFFNLEIPLLTVGEQRYRYAFDYHPQQDEQVRVVDNNADSRDGITMKLPDSLRAVSYVDLDTGVLGSEIYDYKNYNITLSNPNFFMDKDGKITVKVPEGAQYMECDLTLTWLYNKLAFSDYDMSVTIPLVWTNLSMAEQKEFFTAGVRVGNALEGYQTVWSKRVKKNQPFSLPTTSEIKKLINYDSYNNGSGSNMKYSVVKGYGAQDATDLAIYTDTVYDFDVTLKEYTLTVNGIQNVDGTQVSRSYTAKYGSTFDFSDLTGTGTSIADTTYTKFADVTTEATISIVNKDGQTVNKVIDLAQPVTGKMAIALADGNKTATANYVNDTVVATYQFNGIDHADVTQKLKKDSIPNIALIEKIVEEAGAVIGDISPALGKQSASINYIVYCSKQTSSIKKTISFEENGGGQVMDIIKVVGSVIGALPEPTKTGYTFNGWYVDDKLSKLFEQTKVPDTDITLYAKWTPNTYTVTLNANGGAFAGELNTATATVTFGKSYGELPQPSKTGENFAGWYTQAVDGKPVSLVTVAQNHTLYARWSKLNVVYAKNMKLDGLTSLVYDGSIRVVSVTSGSAICVSGSAIGVVTGSAISSDVFTIRYRRSDASEWSDTAINAGLYSVKVSIDTEMYPEYAPFEKTFTDVMTIDKHPSSFLLKTPNQLTGTVAGKGNIIVQKLMSGVDYIGDGTVEYAVLRDYGNGFGLGNPNTWNWQTSNVFVNADGNSGLTTNYVLTARIVAGENYAASELIVGEEKKNMFGLKYWDPTVNTIPIEPGISYPLDANNGYTYKVKIQTSDIKYAGTDAKIYAALSSSPNPVSGSNNKAFFQLDKSGYNDFERGDCDVYDLNTSGGGAMPFNPMLPMNFELYYIEKGTSSGWHCDWIEVQVYKNGKYLQTSKRFEVDKWFEKDGHNFTASIQFKRDIAGTDGFNSNRESLALSAADHSGTHDVTFNGTVYDQFRPEGYNAFDYQYSPEFNITAKGYEDCINRTVNSITLDKDKLYNMMVANKCYTLEFTITLTFDDSVDVPKVISKTIEISRQIIE